MERPDALGLGFTHGFLEDFEPEPTPVHLLSLSGMALTAATRGVVQSLRKQLALARLPGVTTGEH